jgi:putative hydrolase of the HAD superfamily
VEIEAVTIDAFGTLVGLRDPVPPLQAALRERGVERSDDDVLRAFEAEAAYYVPRSWEGRDAATLADLRDRCRQVFLDALGVELDGFPYVECLEFELLPGVADALAALAALPLCVVSNWDIGLHGYLRDLGVDLPVVTSADAGVAKPDPRIFEHAFAVLGTRAVVHVGDSAADEEGARAAGIAFEPAPLADAARRILA